MKSAKARTIIIDWFIKKYKSNEEYVLQLRNGFIPEAIKDEFDSVLAEQVNQTSAPDTDLDRMQYSNWFYLHPEKLIGKEVKGSGYINPINTTGNIGDLDKIPYELPNTTDMKNITPKIKEGAKVEQEHEGLYDEIKARLEKEGVKMPLSKQEFFEKIAKAHIREKADYYTLIKKYVEPETDMKKTHTDGKQRIFVVRPGADPKNQPISKEAQDVVKEEWNKMQGFINSFNVNEEVIVIKDNKNILGIIKEKYEMPNGEFTYDVRKINNKGIIIPGASGKLGIMEGKDLKSAKQPEMDKKTTENTMNQENTEEGVDLFEDYENIPKNVQKVLDKYSQGFEDGNYSILEKALKELNKIGYTFEYYLDGQAYDLRKIGQKGKTTLSADKPETEQQIPSLKDEPVDTPRNDKKTTMTESLIIHRLKNEKKTNGDKTLLTIGDTLKKYNPGITEPEIKGWVYYKRKFGNPMRGWEAYFLKAGKTAETLVYSKSAFYLKDQQFRDVKMIPEGTLIGKKTKFKNEYDKETYWVIKNEANELYYVAESNITEKEIGLAAAQEELTELVKQKGLCYNDGDFIPIPLYAYGNIYDIKDKLVGKFSKELNKYEGGYFQTLVDMFGKDIADWHLKLIDDAIKIKGEFYFNDPTPSKRPFLSGENPISHDYKVRRLNDESGVDFEKIFEFNKKRSERWKRYVEEENEYSLFQAYEHWFNFNVNDSMLQKTTKRNVVDYYFNNRKISGDLTDKEKDEIRLNARIEGEKYYGEFLATALTSADLMGLNITFNRKYNSISKINLDKVPVAFEVNAKIFNSDFTLKPVQRNGIAFMAATNSGCLAYDVGFGKTLTAIHNLAALLKQGAVKRPLIIVPKQVYNNWIREMFGFWTNGQEKRFEQFEGSTFVNGALTGTQYKLNTWFNLSSKVEFQNSLVEPDTITLLTYEGFYKLGFSPSLYEQLFDDLFTILTKGKTDATARQSEKEKENIKKMLGVGIADTVIDIDTCGFDYLVFDEAHAFKNVFNSVPLDEGEKNVWRLAQKSTPTKRAVKAFFHSLYIQKKYNGNVQLLTATPFTNSPLEIYSMLALVGYETLKNYNLQNLYEFLGLFIETEVEYAVNHMNEIVLNTVIKSFKNKNLLRDILYRHFDYQDDPKVAGVKRPCKLNFPNNRVSTYLEMSVKQNQGQEIVRDEAASYDPKTNKGAMGRALNWAKNNAFSPFLLKNIEPYETLDELIEESPKLKYTIECIRTIKEFHDKRDEEMSGVVIYSNRGVDLFEDFKSAIEEACGFKRKVLFGESYVDEVEIILGGGTDKELEHKEVVKDAFNEGYCKVIIGTATIKEGVNLQRRGTTEFNLDLDWNPTDFKQLEGRIHRQGNLFKYVRIVVPMVQNTLDSFVNQKLDEKSKRIASIWDKTNQSNSLEEYAAVDPMEIKFALITDEGELLKMKVDKDKQQALKNSVIAKEKYEAVNKISIVVNEFNTTLEEIKTSLQSTFENHKNYASYLNKYKGKNKDLTKTEITSIDDLLEKINENIVLFEDYYTNGNFKSLFDVFRHINARQYTFKTGSGSVKDFGDLVEMFTGESYYGSLDTYNSWSYKKLIATYGDMKKLERMVLQPYGLTTDDNFDAIKKKFKTEFDTYENELKYLNSIEYQELALQEIKHELERRAKERGTIEERVGEFANYNYLLSYPFVAETADQCEIPHDETEYSGSSKILQDDLEKPDEEIVNIKDISSNDIKKNKVKYEKEIDPTKPINFSKEALVFVPRNQVLAAKSWEYNEAKERINEIVNKIPSYGRNEDKMVYLHYFRGGSDYFVMEKDFDEGYQAVFGYAILNQDYQNSELGSQGLDEIKRYMELDFYFTPKPLNEALADAGHPSYKDFKKEEKELTKQDYQEALEGAEIALEFTDDGKEKTWLEEYIDGLKTAIELM